MQHLNNSKKNYALFLIIFIAMNFLYSCKKDSSTAGNYHLTFFLNDTLKTYNTQAYAIVSSSGGNKGMAIVGYERADTTSPAMGLVITNVPSGLDFSAGIYADSSTQFEVLATYEYNNSSADDYEAGSTVFANALSESVTITNHFKATITSWTNTAIGGTFSGDFYFNGDPKSQKITIRNGDFYLPIQ